MESYKKRLSAVTREKRDYEERFLKVNTELEKKVMNFIEELQKILTVVSLGFLSIKINPNVRLLQILLVYQIFNYLILKVGIV